MTGSPTSGNREPYFAVAVVVGLPGGGDVVATLREAVLGAARILVGSRVLRHGVPGEWRLFAAASSS